MKRTKRSNRHATHALLSLIVIGATLAAAGCKTQEVKTTPMATFPGSTQYDYQGYKRYDYRVNGIGVLVVAPKTERPGRPWVWEAEFFGVLENMDRELLERGFYIVYMTSGNTFGCPATMQNWDAFYRDLTEKHGFAKKAGLVGVSRGGLYVYNWAAAHPDRVNAIYGDNPVCDFKSWPGGKGKGEGSPGDWTKLMKDYGFASEAEALAYRGNPVDNLASIAKANIPILHICGEADTVVPYAENTLVIQQHYNALGGTMRVILKPRAGHHPHGLEDPAPVIDFFLRAAARK